MAMRLGAAVEPGLAASLYRHCVGALKGWLLPISLRPLRLKSQLRLGGVMSGVAFWARA